MVLMKIIVNYDFTQHEFVGKTDVFEVAEGAIPGDLLRMIDVKIMEAGKNKGIDLNSFTDFAEDNNEWVDRFHKPELH